MVVRIPGRRLGWFFRAAAFRTEVMDRQLIGADVLAGLILQQLLHSVDDDIADAAAPGADHVVMQNEHLVVAVCLTDKAELDNHMVLRQIIEAVVDGCKGNGGHFFFRFPKNLFGGEMLIRSLNDLQNQLALLCHPSLFFELELF